MRRGGKLHRTCRQVGNPKGKAQRELAEDHPLKHIYEKRLNTINRYLRRGTRDTELAEAMKKLAKDKMLCSMAYLYHNTRDAVGEFAKKYSCDHVCVCCIM